MEQLRGNRMAMVFQQFALLPTRTVRDNVGFGLELRGDPASHRRRVVDEKLALVGLGEWADRQVRELSGGMQQRVGLARAFALTPRVLLLDEPFGMLDSLTRVELQEVLLACWRQDRKTALMVTHDVDEALFLSDRVVMMTRGPEARVGDTLHVPFERPRSRRAVMEDPRYYELRERIIDFLETETVREVAAEHADALRAIIEPSRGTLPPLTAVDTAAWRTSAAAWNRPLTSYIHGLRLLEVQVPSIHVPSAHESPFK